MMPSFDAVGLSLIWCIGLLAVMQAINARGVWRVAASAILTAVILFVAGFSTYLKFQEYEGLVAPESPSVMESGKAMAVEGKIDDRLAESAKKMAKEGLDLASQIGKIKSLPRNISEPEREKAESKALALRNATAQLNGRAVNAFSGKSGQVAYSRLIRATEDLRLAGYSMHVYATLESAEERDVQFKQGKSRAESAMKELKACLSDLEFPGK